jgi:hypothetical protein
MKIIPLVLLIFLSFSSWAQVWPHDQKKSWNEAVESEYSRWVAESVSTDFLTRPGRFYSHIKVDCADFQYLLRLVFARQNGLEFAINDPENKGQILSSRSSRWNSIIDPSERALQFFNYIKAHTGTYSLPRDTVLVAMNRESLRPGVILLGDLRRGHSMVIKKIRPSGLPVLIYGSLPAEEFLYPSYHYPDAFSYFPMGPVTHVNGGGFRRFKWPQDLMKPLNMISYASSDQLNSGRNLKIFFEEIQKSVRIQAATIDESLNYLVEDLCAQVRVRVNTITEAMAFLRSDSFRRSGGRISAVEEDRYSTHKRDESIRVLISRMKESYLANAPLLKAETKFRIDRVLNPAGYESDECIVEWAENTKEPLGWIIERFETQKLVSSEATDSLCKRWGRECPK